MFEIFSSTCSLNSSSSNIKGKVARQISRDRSICEIYAGSPLLLKFKDMLSVSKKYLQ